MEGARWDRQEMVIEESQPKVLYDAMPVIWLRPGKKSEISHEQEYECPGEFVEKTAKPLQRYAVKHIHVLFC